MIPNIGKLRRAKNERGASAPSLSICENDTARSSDERLVCHRILFALLQGRFRYRCFWKKRFASYSTEPWPIRIIMDVVINHSGDNWGYPGDYSYNYDGGQQFAFGTWRKSDRPIPIELRNPDYYHRCGQIGNYEALPEYQLGDIDSLKDYENDDNPVGSLVINALITVFCYWIREADVDGFRVDAVKHMGAIACSRFCSNVREYAYALGKRGFFLYGEVAEASDDLYNSYLGPNTSVQIGNDTVFFGLDSVLDFRLAEGLYQDPNNAPLPTILKAQNGPQGLFNRLELQLDRALNRGESGRYPKQTSVTMLKFNKFLEQSDSTGMMDR
jgi:hypothetical protein